MTCCDTQIIITQQTIQPEIPNAVVITGDVYSDTPWPAGEDGRLVEFSADGVNMLWRYVWDTEWTILAPLPQDGYTPVKGVDYEDGAPGADWQDGTTINSIQRTAGDGSPGTTDTYTITYNDTTTSTFQVYNGADGSGAGDMTKAIYDTNDSGKVDEAEAVARSGVNNKPSNYPPEAHTHTKADITDFNDGDYATAAQGVTADSAVQPWDLATVATSGSYGDLTGTPTIPTGDMEKTTYDTDNNGVVDKAQSIIETRNDTQTSFRVGTEAQYDAIGTKDANTIYHVTS